MSFYYYVVSLFLNLLKGCSTNSYFEQYIIFNALSIGIINY